MPTHRHDTYHCSFCGKIATEVEHVIAGPGVYICNECVGLCDAHPREEADASVPLARRQE